jgi:spore maturation protein CgeB
VVGNIYGVANELILTGDYDAVFHVAFNESLDFPESAAKMALKKDIPVIQWDCDASWRFGTWILPRKERVSHFITTHAQTVPWYQKHGMNAIKSQWGGSPLYKNTAVPPEYDVTFIGQKHGQYNGPQGTRFVRAEIVDALMSADIKVDLFGNYWDGYSNWHGYITDFHKMLRVFNSSKICLNLSNPWHVGTMPQIKGRHFEIPQTGGFQLCTPADDLENYFEPDKEIVIVNSIEDMVEKIHYYLEHNDERQAIAQAGNDRMLKDHQWEHRFEQIFKEVGVL